MFKIIIMICALNTNCNETTSLQTLNPPLRFNNDLGCLKYGQEFMANLAIGPQDNEYIKFKCQHLKG